MLSAAGNPAASLLVGAKVSLLEAGTAWSLGSNRSAAASIRTFIENAVSWLYYKDHPVEFDLVARRLDDLWLPKAVISSYLSKIDPTYEAKHADLFKKGSRPEKYFYSWISDYVHAHPSFVGLKDNISALVVSVPSDAAFKTVCAHVDEFVSDVYSSHYRANFAMMPDPVKANLEARLGDKLARWVSN